MTPIVQLPFGEGRRFLNGGGWTNWSFGGWTVSAVIQMQSGFPIGVSQNTNTNSFCSAPASVRTSSPGQDFLVGGSITDRLRDNPDDDRYLNPAAFAQAPAGTFGNSPRTLPGVYSPWRNSTDVAHQQGLPARRRPARHAAARDHQPVRQPVVCGDAERGVRQRQLRPRHVTGELLEDDADHGDDSRSRRGFPRGFFTRVPHEGSSRGFYTRVLYEGSTQGFFTGVRRAPVEMLRPPVLLALFTLAGVVGVLKGLTPTLDPKKEFYWLFSYQYGFIKRGLIGTLVHPLLKFWSFEALKPMIVGAHVIACLWIIFVLQMLFQQAARRDTRRDAGFTLALAFLCLMCSPLMPVLAHDSGYVDVYLIALVLGALWLVLHERYVAAGVVSVAGPLIHEGFIFLWCPLAIMLLRSCATIRIDRAKKLLVAVLPVLWTAVVIWAHNRHAIDLLMADWNASDEVKSGHIVFTFGQTLQSSFEHMRRYEFPGALGQLPDRPHVLARAEPAAAVGGGVLLLAALDRAMDDLVDRGGGHALAIARRRIGMGSVPVPQLVDPGGRDRADRRRLTDSDCAGAG